MQLAVARDANTIWILNVGDMKPYEMHIEFFISLGWNASIWNPDNLNTFVSSWAAREFDLSTQESIEVATIIANLTRWNSRRKPESWNATTFSLTNYRECVCSGCRIAIISNSSSSQSGNRLVRLEGAQQCLNTDLRFLTLRVQTRILRARTAPDSSKLQPPEHVHLCRHQ